MRATDLEFDDCKWAIIEARRRENAAEMEGVDGVGEMMARRALPPATSDDGSADE